MLNILFYSKIPEKNYQLSKKSFKFYLLFITILFPLLYFLRSVYISFIVSVILLGIGIIELNIAKSMLGTNENKCLDAYRKGKLINIVSKAITIIMIFMLYSK